jgi:hypothetical protein
MKSIRLPSGATLGAQQYNALRDDASGQALLLAHQQLGALALGTNPTNGQTITFTVNGSPVVLTAKTVLANPGDFLIQSTPAANVAVIWNALTNPIATTSTFIGFNTTATAANAQLLQYVGWGLPTGGTTITPFSLNTSTAAPLISFTASTTITGGTWTAQTMQLYVESGTYYIGVTRVLFLGGSTPTFTAPVSNPRIDLVTADSSGTIAVVTGTEASTPVAPAYPSNKLVLCEVYHVVGETAIYDNDNQQSGKGYISNDSRPSLAPPYISSASQVASNLFIPWIPSPVQGDIAYYNGSAWTRLPAGTSGYFLQTQGSGANPQWSNPTPFTLAGAYASHFSAIAIYDDANIPSDGGSTTPVKVHEIQMPAGMPTLTVTVGIAITSPSGYVGNGQVYKNGVAQSISVSGSDGAVHTAIGSISVSAGDLIQVYLWSNTSGITTVCNEFAILGMPVPSEFIPTKNS